MRRFNPYKNRLAAALLAIALVGAFFVNASSFVFAKSDELNTASVAQGHAQVVAQGMTAPPAAKSRWRVVKRSVPVRTTAQPADNLMGGAGFLVAGDRAVLVIDQKYKTRTRLAAGESLFIPAGAIQTWASLDAKPASAYTLELVADKASTDIPNGKIVHAEKNAFAISQGDYVVDLVRDVLVKNEKGKVGKSSYATLVMAMSGALSVKSDAKGAAAVTLKGGQAGAYPGNLAITAGKDGGSYVAAVIGPATGVSNVKPVSETPASKATAGAKPTEKATATEKAKATKTPTPKTPTATPKKTTTPKKTKPKTSTATPTEAPSAQVVVGISVCPPGIRPETGVPGLVNCSAGFGGYDLNLVTPDGTILTLANASEVTGSYVAWSGLPAGDYQLIIMAIPEGYDSVTLDGYLCCSVNGGYALTVGDGDYVTGTLYFYQPDAAPTPDPAVTDAATAAPPADAGNGADGGQQPAG